MIPLSYLGLWIFLIAELVYNHYATANSTNWHIFYFSATTLSALLISVDLMFKQMNKAIILSSVAFCVFFFILILIELTRINMPFDEYIVSVNDNRILFMLHSAIAIALILICMYAWEKIRLKG